MLQTDEIQLNCLSESTMVTDGRFARQPSSDFEISLALRKEALL